MDEAGAGRVYRREIFIGAKPETVFGFLVDPAKMRRWMGVAHALDPRPGGGYRVDVTGSDIAVGSYTAVVPHRRVAFTWGWEGAESSVPPGSSLVEIELTPRDGGTMVRLTHSGLPEAVVERHGIGWEHYCDRLAVVAAGGDPGADPWVKG